MASASFAKFGFAGQKSALLLSLALVAEDIAWEK